MMMMMMVVVVVVMIQSCNVPQEMRAQAAEAAKLAAGGLGRTGQGQQVVRGGILVVKPWMIIVDNRW